VAKRTKSGLKRKRQTAKRTVQNQAVQSRVKTLVKKAREASQASGTGQPSADLHAAIQALDSAAHKGILHRNTAARKKSRLMRHLARTSSAPAPA
jgi:small subunit ribosomal protein S20